MSGSASKFLTLNIESTGKVVIVALDKILYFQEFSAGTSVYIRDNHSIYVKQTMDEIRQALRSA